MKKIILIAFAYFFLSYPPTVFGQNPLDIAYHAVPASPAIDIPEDVAQVGANVQSVAEQGNQFYIQAKANVTNLNAAGQAMFNEIVSGAILSGDNPGQNAASYCGKDIQSVDVKNVAEKMKSTFMDYPSFKWEDQNRTNQMRDQFYIDNIYAIHTASVILQQELKKDKDLIEKMRECLDNHNDTACNDIKSKLNMPASDGKNEAWAAYVIALRVFDSLIQKWENVAALKARLRAIKAMEAIKPEVVEKKTSYLKDGANVIAQIRSSEPLAFAQLTAKAPAASLAQMESKIAGDKTEAKRLVTQGIKFIMPDEADNQHPLVAAEEKLEELSKINPVEDVLDEAMSAHNILRELKSYKETADVYDQMTKEYEKTLEKLKKSDQCAIKYLSSYFSDPVKVWSGVDLKKHPNAHNLRKGISGWAHEAYEVAKSAETSIITTEDLAQISLDEKTKADLLDDPDFKKNEKQGQKTTVSLSASKREKMHDENRNAELKPWQIGAEASKILAADAAKWGSPLNKKMVWTDTKNFYNQYLRRKYDNIKSYLKVYTRNDVLALVVAKLKGKTQDINDTKYQKKLQESQAKAAEKMVANLDGVIASQQQFDAQSKSAVNSLQRQRESLIAKMDKVTEAVKASSDKVADIRSVAEEKAFQKISDAVLAPVVYPSSTQVKIIGTDKLAASVAQNQTALTDDKKIASLEQQQKRDAKKLENYEKELEKLDSQIASAKLASQEKAAEALNQGAVSAEAIEQALVDSIKLDNENYAADVHKNLMAILTKSAALNPLLNPVVMLAAAEEAADISLNKVYEQVDNIVDGGYQQMLAMGDTLYTPEGQSKLVEIHNRMVERLKGIMLAYSVAGLIKVKDIAIYAKLELADISPETEGFFVGASAKARDLKAPYAIPDFDLPPVREVFHFDAADFAVIKPKVKGKKTSGRSLTASDFLNYGGDIPPIWQEMLKDKAFIESRFNLKEALDYGCTNVAFARGGIMPCVIKGSSIVLDVNGDGEYLRRNDISSASLPECLLVSIKNGKPHHTFWDAPVSFAPLSGGLLNKLVAEKPAAQHCEYSELGMLLEADDNNNLKFKELAFETYNNMLEDGNNKELSNKQKNKVAAGYHASLMRNQIGDFLRQAENEKTQRENLEEYKKKYDAQMEQLKQRLRTYGFEPAASFDLRKDSDYKLAVNKLKAIRNQKTAKASSLLSSIKKADNAPVQERVNTLNKLVSAMKNDKDGLMKVSVITPDNNNFNADLKKAKADAAVVDKYKKSLKEQAKNYNDVLEPYCANY